MLFKKNKDKIGFNMGRYEDVSKLNAVFSQDEVIIKEAKRRGDIIHGSRAVKSQIGLFGREPSDWDILAKNPRKSAKIVENKLDRLSGRDMYYLEEEQHKGTVRLKSVGFDNKKKTRDDVNVADYTPPSRNYKTNKLLDGLRVVDIDETLSDKRKALKRPEFKYRSEKDGEDVERISFFKKYIDSRNDGLE